MTSAHADLISNSAQVKINKILGGTIDLQIRAFTVSYFEVDLHRLTTNLAVFNVRLVTATGVQQDADRFATERATYSAFHDIGVHGQVRAATGCRSTVLW